MVGPARPYRSKSVKPCDACRKRRIACIRDEGENVCSLCKHRKAACTFLSNPQVRRKCHNSVRHASLSPPSSVHHPSPQRSNSTSDGVFDSFELTNIEASFSPCLEELIRLYYQYAHPSYPILGTRSVFEAKRRRHTLSGLLLAIVCLHGREFWHASPLAQFQEPPATQNIVQNLYGHLMTEGRHPTLETLQSLLLYLHLPAKLIETSTYTNTWSMSSTMVSMAQELGLNIDPEAWRIPEEEERKTRRILWWAVFVHDKWMACWLERPSHITYNTWDVKHATLLDFAEESGNLSPEAAAYAESFLSLCTITELLSDTLDTFFGVRSRFDNMSVGDALSKASCHIERLRVWKTEHPTTTTTADAHHFTSQMASYATCIAIHRALHGAYASSQRNDACSLVNHIVQSIRNDLFNMFRALKRSGPLGLWLCYAKGMVSMFGLSIATIVQTSPDQMAYRDLHDVLLDYKAQLHDLADEVPDGQDTFGWAANRLQPVVEEMSADGSPCSSNLGSSPEEYRGYHSKNSISYLPTPPSLKDNMTEISEPIYDITC